MPRRLRNLALLFIALLACPGTSARGQQEQTLRQTLAGQRVPLDPAKLPNAEKRITSGAMLNDFSQLVIAYYLAEQGNELNPPLFVDRYDRKKSDWETTALGGASDNGQRLDGECSGSVSRIEAIGARFAVETMLNPSAGCALIFSDDLKLQATLFGWVIGELNNDEIIYERSQVHFAAVHAAEIALYDLRNRRDITIFSHKPYQAVWQARVAQLRQFYKTHQSWCQENNDPCDPEQFDSSLEGNVVTNDGKKAVAFLMSFAQIQVFAHPKPSGPEQVVYVYLHADEPARMKYREMLMGEVKAEFGNVSLKSLLEPERLAKIFHETPR